jgi:hypothetical protein
MTASPVVDDLFAGREIAISISESPELAELGFSEEHLVEAMREFARTVLSLGGTIAYGGDLRPGGFTEHLLALARRIPARREHVVHCYLCWPINLTQVPARVADLEPIVDADRLPSGPGEHMAWARNLTAMRALMADRTAARIAMGGRVAGSRGAMPGLLEEALLTLQRGQPLFVLGAFGGCGRVLWDALNGRPVPELDLDYQAEHDPGYRAFHADYNAWAAASGAPGVDYAAIRDYLAELGPGGLGNGLDAGANARLAETPYIDEMVALVLQGCRAKFT